MASSRVGVPVSSKRTAIMPRVVCAHFVLASLLLAGATQRASAASPVGPAFQAGSAEDAVNQAPEPNAIADALRVSLLTIGQGDQMWDSFGHNVILVENLRTGQSIAYDWGRFSWAQEGFLKNLLMGRMQYSMGVSEPQVLFSHYESLNRSVTVQHLSLEADAKLAMIAEMEANRANPDYRYEYFLDNCSTRVRDLLNEAAGGAIALRSAVPEEEYRFHTRRLTQHNVALWAGFDVLLGNGGDQPIPRWAGLFTPLELIEEVRETEVEVNGTMVPLVASEEVVYASTRPAEDEEPRSMMLTFLLLGVVLGGVIAFLGFRSGRDDRAARAGFALLAGSWSLVAGVVGVALLFVLVTDHVWMHWNENALQFTPLSLVLVPLVALTAWRGRAGPAVLRLAGAAAALSVLGFVLQVFPGFDQGNGELIALALPIHLGLAWAVWEIAPGPGG